MTLACPKLHDYRHTSSLGYTSSLGSKSSLGNKIVLRYSTLQTGIYPMISISLL